MGTEKTNNANPTNRQEKIEIPPQKNKKTDSEKKIETVKIELNISQPISKAPLTESHKTSLPLKMPSDRADYALDQLTKVLSVEAKNKDDLLTQYGYLNRYLDQYEKALKEDSFLKWIGFVASKYIPFFTDNSTIKQSIEKCDAIEKIYPDIGINYQKTRVYMSNQTEQMLTKDLQAFLSKNGNN